MDNPDHIGGKFKRYAYVHFEKPLLILTKESQKTKKVD